MISTAPGEAVIARLDGAPAGLTITARLVDGDETLPTVVTVTPVLDITGDPLNAYEATFEAPDPLPVELQWLDDATLVGAEIVAAVTEGIVGVPMTAMLEGAPAGLDITARLVDGDETLDTTVTVAPILDAAGDPLNAYVATFDTPLSPPVTIEWLQGATVVGSEAITTTSDTFTQSTLVSLAALKNYLSIPATDTSHDARLTRAIHGARAVVEDITGPIIPATFTEWHTACTGLIRVHRPPSRGFGTTPVLTLLRATEHAGGTTTDLAAVVDPSEASGDCAMFDDLGLLTRLTTGGAPRRFSGRVRVVYVAGQRTIPANVHEATLELIRVNTQTTQAVGRGRLTVADDQDSSGPALGFFVPRRVRELLAPNDDAKPLVA